MTTTYTVSVCAGHVTITPCHSPAVAPPPQGREAPLRTVGEVKAFAREQVRFMGFDRRTAKAAREFISLLTVDDCNAGCSRWF